MKLSLLIGRRLSELDIIVSEEDEQEMSES